MHIDGTLRSHTYIQPMKAAPIDRVHCAPSYAVAETRQCRIAMPDTESCAPRTMSCFLVESLIESPIEESL